MKFAFHYKSLDKFSKQQTMMDAVIAGAKRHGDEVFGVDHTSRVDEADGAVVLGIGKKSRHVFEAYKDKKIVYFDTGYVGISHFRISVNSFQPLNHLMAVDRPSDRWKRLGIKPAPFRKERGRYILFDGGSHKFINWHKLGGTDFREQWHNWGRQTVETISYYTQREIIYRPRPTNRAMFAPAKPIPGTIFSQGPLEDDFARAHIVVSYGGSIGVDTIVHGLPHFAIGTSIARPVSETNWGNLDTPRILTDAERNQWLYNLAYWQWTIEEIEQGKAWGHIKEYL